MLAVQMYEASFTIPRYRYNGYQQRGERTSLLLYHTHSDKYALYLIEQYIQFSVPQIEYPLGGSSKKGSHVYFLLQDFCAILLFCQIVLLFDINVLTSQ